MLPPGWPIIVMRIPEEKGAEEGGKAVLGNQKEIVANIFVCCGADTWVGMM